MSKPSKTKKITNAELEEKFDNGESIDEYLDFSTTKVNKPSLRRTTLDMPIWMAEELDAEAQRRGITRQGVIKNWLTDRLDQERGKR